MNNDEFILHEQKVKLQLDEEASKTNHKKCVKKVLDFYNKNQHQCDTAFANNEHVKNTPRSFIDSQETIDIQCFKNKIKDIPIILVLTANDIENNILIWNLKKESANNVKSYLVQNRDGCININFCKFKKYILVHHHVGKTGDEATRRAINDLSHFFSPNFIVLLGICYGLDMNTQEIGCVNISEQVIGVRINFRDKPNSDEIIFEPEVEFDEKPNEHLTSTITRTLNNSEIKESVNADPIRHMYGGIVSANSLMSCKIVKDSIIGKLQQDIRGRSKLIGGEMEACGIFKSNFLFRKKVKFDYWIVIKSICDWGESKNSLVDNKEENSRIKDSLQAYAMMCSCSIFLFLLKNQAFK